MGELTAPQLLEEFKAFLASKEGSQSPPKAPQPASKSPSSKHYLEREELDIKGLIIFKHSQKKNGNWYMRFYLGSKKYKVECLGTTNRELARQEAINRWRNLQNQLEKGEQVIQRTISSCIDEYLEELQARVKSKQIKPNTLSGKISSMKTLSRFLIDYKYPKDIPSNCFSDYIQWRRGEGYRQYHKNNPNPPTDSTINKELSDINRFFIEYLMEHGLYKRRIKLPFIKIRKGYYHEKNIAFTEEDWIKLVNHIRPWISTCKDQGKNTFYRELFGYFLRILANTGMRPHEALLLRWKDITFKQRDVLIREIHSDSGEKLVQPGDTGECEGIAILPITDDEGKYQNAHRVYRRERIAEIRVSHETKTGSRLVISPAGFFFEMIRMHYLSHKHKVTKDDYIFKNVGQSNQHDKENYGKPFTINGFRHYWYELINGLELENHYTIYSCRSFYINQRLELGVPPHIVAKLVGHSVETMEKHYEDINIRRLTKEVVTSRKQLLDKNDFLTFDIDIEAFKMH